MISDERLAIADAMSVALIDLNAESPSQHEVAQMLRDLIAEVKRLRPAPVNPELDVDEEWEDAEHEYWREREEEMLPCGCKLCICFERTEYGEPCYDCANHAHQG